MKRNQKMKSLESRTEDGGEDMAYTILSTVMGGGAIGLVTGAIKEASMEYNPSNFGPIPAAMLGGGIGGVIGMLISAGIYSFKYEKDEIYNFYSSIEKLANNVYSSIEKLANTFEQFK